MSSILRFRFAAVLLLLVSMSATLFGQGFFRLSHRRMERRSTVVVAPPTLSPAEANTELQRLTDEIKANPRELTAGGLNRCQKLLLDSVINLQQRLPREFDKEAAADWNTTLQLAELKTTLATETPDSAILEAAQIALYSDKEGARWIIFEPLRTALRRYQRTAKMLNEDSYVRQWTNVCENLVKFIDKYNEGNDPAYFAALCEAVDWLDDISLFDPRASALAKLARTACSGVNLRLNVGSDFIAAGFQQEINQVLDIDETILGTKVIGEGILVGASSAELIRSRSKAAINVLAEATMETHTDGKHPPVTLKNYTTGTLHGEKQILISANAITTAPARSRANLTSEISNVRINAGPIIRLIARTQIGTQKEDSEAEAERRAARRMNNQLNERIDSNIAELDEKYQKIRNALNKTGLFPRVWNLSSTDQQIDWSVLLGNSSQPSAPFPAPELQSSNGLAVQVHQSALNNMLAILLAGRYIDEEKSSARIAEFFEETPKFLERKSEETPAKVSFGTRIPVDVLFVENKIRVVVRLNDIQVMDNVGRSFTISVEYKIKTEDRDGQKMIVLEQTEVEAFPAGYKSEGGTSLSAAQTMIRAYLLRRLESLPKRYEAEPLALKGEWEGKGELIPQFASSENGWLNLVWSWKAAE